MLCLPSYISIHAHVFHECKPNTMPKQTFPEPDPGRKIAKIMMYLAWVSTLGVLTWFFTIYEGNKQNPNQTVIGTSSENFNEISLKRNAYGHYLASGSINGESVNFLLDTGATNVSVPEKLAEALQLKPLARARSSTANGFIEVFVTRIDELRIGNIAVYDVSASINPGMNHSDSVLLGMSVLKHVEFTQKGDTLILRQPKSRQ